MQYFISVKHYETQYDILSFISLLLETDYLRFTACHVSYCSCCNYSPVRFRTRVSSICSDGKYINLSRFYCRPLSEKATVHINCYTLALTVRMQVQQRAVNMDSYHRVSLLQWPDTQYMATRVNGELKHTLVSSKWQYCWQTTLCSSQKRLLLQICPVFAQTKACFMTVHVHVFLSFETYKQFRSSLVTVPETVT